MSPTKVASQRVALGDITPNNIGQLRKLHNVLFPVKYDDKCYNNILEAGELAKLVYYNDVCVGAVCSQKNGEKIEVLTLGVLKPYRGLGLGQTLLNHILDQAKERGSTSIDAYVQTSDDSAVAFYKHHGFELISTEKDYFKQLDQKDAYVFSKSTASSQ
ncbi:N-alpha-acetyltransferase 50 [Apophysomyces sp. BC1034]|nr:N-alpha-acetyltransferase 50 [Apophysomyces sp. BC1015]KAG0175584.1 N-alpha-acetyltransferase 50 [Apophysomyces sp. BC1021]KAG0186253.1 N-alpha-acetyltransferase 50 [Apophysomyces sp. BC1034]